MSKVNTILDILRQDARIGFIIKASNGTEFNFRGTTLIIDAPDTPEGMIHAVLPVTQEEYMREILAKLIENISIPSFFSMYLEYGSYGIIYPTGSIMSQDHIREIVYMLLYSKVQSWACTGPVTITVYSIMNSPAMREHIAFLQNMITV